jgi:hypothetical protein
MPVIVMTCAKNTCGWPTFSIGFNELYFSQNIYANQFLFARVSSVSSLLGTALLTCSIFYHNMVLSISTKLLNKVMMMNTL